MWIRFCMAVLLMLGSGPLAVGADGDNLRIPVYVWFKYGGPLRVPCPNATQVAQSIAETLTRGIKPYLFVKGATEDASHLRIELSREKSQSMSLRGDLYGYSIAGGPAANSVPQGPFDMGRASYEEGLPPCPEWANRIIGIITKPDALNQLKTDLRKNMPFAKGIQVLNPPSPRNVFEARLLILAPLDPEFASSGRFDVEYDPDKKMGAVGVACTPGNLVVVEPADWITITANKVDYGRLNQDSKNRLIYAYDPPPRRIVECKSESPIVPSPPPKQIPRKGGPQ